ncbi:hypothetical protein HDU67_010175 [Dinochytrium kinnereticum]|nr:hypothetical protein HDU67_010175 [Dinochytrium kinnereticum]
MAEDLQEKLNLLCAKFDPKDHELEAARSRVQHLCRISSRDSSTANDSLFVKLAEHNSKVRYKAVLVVDLLFTQSHLFRAVFLRRFHKFAQLSLGIQDHRLPEPKEFATKCREIALSAIKRWNEKYGAYYKQLEVGYNFLVDRMKVDFSGTISFLGKNDPHIHEKKRLQAVRQQIFEATTKEVEEELPSIFENITKMWSLVDILDSRVAISMRSVTLSLDTDLSAIARAHGLTISEYGEAPTLEGEVLPLEGDENQIVFDSLRECVKLVATKHISLMEKWQRSVVKLEEDAPNSSRYLRLSMGLKAFLSQVRQQAVDLLSRSIVTMNAEDFEDEDFEEV